MSSSFHICHFTSVHSRYDIRIFHKQCSSLVKAGYRVTLVVADGNGDEFCNGVSIKDVGRCESGRFHRMTNTAWRVYKRVREESADLYHFHDPELIPAGFLLKKRKPVIYDVHEDVPRQILAKHYLPKPLHVPIARCVEGVEKYTAMRFSAISAATPYIRDRFKKYHINCVDINNYPKLDELVMSNNVSWHHRQKKICYIGGISAARGIRELINAMADIDCRLDLAGSFSPASLREEMIDLPGWTKINELGFVNRGCVKKVLAMSRVGIVTFHPVPNHINAQPNKLFEYLSAGIPVIASDFPLWRNIVRGYECGILVDPLKPKEISEAIDWSFNNPKEAEQMGKNGRKAVENFFNWENEEKKLINLYRKLVT